VKKLIVLLTLAYLMLNTHTYAGLNEGVVLDLRPTHYSVGLEVVGEPGVFVCSDAC
jgi:hypothetical protein